MSIKEKMAYEEFCKEQMERKGYVCPRNPWDNPIDDFKICGTCKYFKTKCIVFGKKRSVKHA